MKALATVLSHAAGFEMRQEEILLYAHWISNDARLGWDGHGEPTLTGGAKAVWTTSS